MTNEEAVTYGNELIQCSAGPLREFAELATRALRSPAPGAVAMREALLAFAEKMYLCYASSDDSAPPVSDESLPGERERLAFCVDEFLSGCALPAPEVPEAVKAWVASYDDEATAGAHHLAADDALRDWIRKEYGL